MNRNYLRPVLILAVMLLIGNTGILMAQVTFKAIVLINGSPYLVDLSRDGSISQTYQSIPNYFEITATDQKIISDLTKQGLIEQDDFSIQRRSTAFQEYTSPPSQNNEGISVIRDRRFISFNLDRAVLNRDAVDQVRNIADAFQEKRFEIVQIHAFHLDTGKTRTLASNRAKAIADLLETFGVSPSAIRISLPVTIEKSDLSLVNLSFE